MGKNNNIYMDDFFANLGPKRCLEIATIMVKELRFNEEISNDYNIEISSKLRLILEDYILLGEVLKEKEKGLESLNKFSSLSLENQKKIVDLVIPYFIKIVDNIEKADVVMKCGQKGHDYTDSSWKFHEWETLEKVCIDHQVINDFSCKHIKWTRQCPTCGFVEESLIEPQEVIKQRKVIDKKEKIKTLQRQINKLQKSLADDNK